MKIWVIPLPIVKVIEHRSKKILFYFIGNELSRLPSFIAMIIKNSGNWLHIRSLSIDRNRRIETQHYPN